MRVAVLHNAAFRWLPICLLTSGCLFGISFPAKALVVADKTNTTSKPADDPGWDYVTGHGSRNYVYLGNGWALSAFHVGLPDLESDPSDNAQGQEDPDNDDEPLIFSNGSFVRIKGQAFQVMNPCFYKTGSQSCGSTNMTNGTDLRLIRLNGELTGANGLPLPNLAIASLEITENTHPQLSQRQVTIMGPGPTGFDNTTHWRATQVAGTNPNGTGNDDWTESCGGAGQLACNASGFKSVFPDDDTKRWGTNLIADEDVLFGCTNNNCDTDLRGKLTLNGRDIISMFTQFDAPGSGSTALTNEAQAVAGDSGSAVFYKRGSSWELIGITNAVIPPLPYDRLPNPSVAIYGSYMTFADLTYYRDSILRIMNDNPFDLIMGDINLDGSVSGNGTGSIATDDVSAFVAGWLQNNGTGVGNYASWLKGDLNKDGKTDVTDFFMLRSALMSTGSGGNISLSSITGGAVPEPTSLLLAIAGAAALACWRGMRRR